MLIVVILSIFICVWYFLYCLDRKQVQKHAKARGWTINTLRWEPLGPGCFGRHLATIFFIKYTTRNGTIRKAYCMSGISGVFFTEEKITFKPKKDASRDTAEKTECPERARRLGAEEKRPAGRK